MALVCGATCFLACGMQVWSTEAVVDDEGEGQVRPCQWTMSGGGQTLRLGLRDRRSRRNDRGD
jgi:hypothetical protein